jgi:dTDP-4-amino-4,6-dideoxygalactose transaminase
VISVLRSDFLTQGPQVPAFEAAVGAHTGAAYAIAVNSATSALHIACIALGVGPGDVVWTVPTTFVASANCALYCGASVDFVDIDPIRYTMCPKALQAKLKTASNLPKAIIPVHLCGPIGRYESYLQDCAKLRALLSLRMLAMRLAQHMKADP